MSNQPISNEDLLKLLETGDVDNLKEDELETLVNQFALQDSEIPTIVEFLEKFNIKSGTTRIRIGALFNVYKIYYQNKLTKHKFSDIVKTLLPNPNNGRGFVYINSEESKIPPKVIVYASYKKETNVLKYSKQLDEYLKFIQHYEIKPGKITVSFEYLYKIYSLFVKNSRARYNYDDFDEIMCKTFRAYWIYSSRFYLLNIPKEGLLCREEQKTRSENSSQSTL